MTTEQRWQRAQALFEQLADQPAATWDARLAELEQDAALRKMVLSLLQADRASGDFIDSAIASAATATTQSPERAGMLVGPYRIVRELGRGGMGSVFLAERADDNYRAHVAIKFLHSVLASPDIERRFRLERQILADLDHPNIARLVDGGQTADGTPYLVMEYVDGVPVDEWCTEQQLSTRARVALVCTLCDAVQQAHQALIVHRDLKPANILVTADGTPKLLDFGIARLLQAEQVSGVDRTMYQAMTPTYASPEQLRGDPVGTSSDTYSLGVVLYRLLAGVPPHQLAGLSPAEVERIVCTGHVAPPSTHASPAVARAIRGDLDTIVLKALHVDPAMRYGTASELADDLRRWQHREPVRARPVTMRYRMLQFIRRHPVAVSATVVALLALGALGTTSVVQARRATMERDRAQQRQAVAEGATNFLIELFTLTDPSTEGGALLTAREMLDEGAQRVRTGALPEPEVRATLAVALATIYRNLALYDEAGSLIDTAVDLRARLYGTTSTEYAFALHERAEYQYNLGWYDSTAALHRQVLAIQENVAPGDNDLTEATLYGLGSVLDEIGQYEEAERHLREGLAMRRRLEGDSSISVATSLLGLASVLRHTGRYPEAIAALEQALAIHERHTGRRTLDVAQVINHLARTMSLAGRPAEALPLAQEAASIQHEMLKVAHPETAATLGNVSGILSTLGRYEEAAEARRESLEMLQASVGPEHPYVAGTMASMAELMARQQRWADAAGWYERSVAVQRNSGQMPRSMLATSLLGLGRALLRDNRGTEAQPHLIEARQLYEQEFGAGDERTRGAVALLDSARKAGRSP